MSSKKVIIVPHTHWDREWYLPFQQFRHMLVKLMDQLLKILKHQDYRFMLDGQTIILEDYFEIRPERKDEVLQHIREGKLAAGPLYLLPDEWLVGGESLIRNLEFSHVLATRFDIPQMQVAYLPDQFGHSSAIPQILGNLTNLKAAVLWRGVPPEIMTVPFYWKSHPASTTQLPGVYMPGGYGNSSRFPEDYNDFVEVVNENITDLEPFSPVSIHLLMNGSDHLFPQPFVQEFVNRLKKSGLDIELGFVNDYVEALDAAIESSNYERPVYTGEFRSPAQAPLLQDTYSARMWIKILNQRVEDLLTQKAEPISTYLWFHLGQDYPSGFLETSWKWLLRNHPHDSICGCSVDQTHEEMKARFSWAESIAQTVIDDAIEFIGLESIPSESSSVIAFNPCITMNTPILMKFNQPKERNVRGLQASDGTIYEVQKLESKEDVFLDISVGIRTAKMGMRLLPGRKLMNFYINGIEYYDGDEPGLLELRFIAETQPVGEVDMADFKRQAYELLESKRYKKIHLVAARPTQTVYVSAIPLTPFAFEKLIPVETEPEFDSARTLQVSENQVSNKFYDISFAKDGTLTYHNKETGVEYTGLHTFEDFGDRGDEYTFGRVLPERVKVKSIKRSVQGNGPVIAEIHQQMKLEIYECLDDTRNKRIGKTEIPIDSVFRFYSDSPRIEIRTKLTNTARDHRLRICFDLPFTSETTQTDTHFGYVERTGDPEKIPNETELERTSSSYPEMPSGIQPQKRYIRVNDVNGNDGITVFNKGLPEVELVNGKRIAVTLVRSVGWLSRSDYPERPMHAGPGEETPGAQELGSVYTFDYGFVIHTKETLVHTSADHAEAFSEEGLAIALEKKKISTDLLKPLIRLDNQSIRISSL
ncbi:MAG: glycoside hydrolase family 38 C-terminal domain-containing protein, partial [Candidatus Thorarchaeota archaeon]